MNRIAETLSLQKGRESGRVDCILASSGEVSGAVCCFWGEEYDLGAVCCFFGPVCCFLGYIYIYIIKGSGV